MTTGFSFRVAPTCTGTFGNRVGSVSSTLWSRKPPYASVKKLQLADHALPVDYQIALPPAPRAKVERGALYVHQAAGRRGREIDAATERFVDETRIGAAE